MSGKIFRFLFSITSFIIGCIAILYYFFNYYNVVVALLGVFLFIAPFFIIKSSKEAKSRFIIGLVASLLVIAIGGGSYYYWFYWRPGQIARSIKIDPLAIQTNPDGSKIYPAQYNNLWGHEFYTSKIDQSGSIDIGSEAKQGIAQLLKSLAFPPALTKKLVIVNVDPTVIQPNDQIKIPWGDNNATYPVSIQPEGGLFQPILQESEKRYYGGFIIALNNLQGYDKSILTHELGHLIAHEMTPEEWKQYYKLRGIPSSTSRNISEWNLSPNEDFAEVYMAINKPGNLSEWSNERYKWNIKTYYGLLMSGEYTFFDEACQSLFMQAEQAYTKVYAEKNPNYYSDYKNWGEVSKQAASAANVDSQVQACRRKNNGPSEYGGMLYVSQVSASTEQFIKGVVVRLREL